MSQCVVIRDHEDNIPLPLLWVEAGRRGRTQSLRRLEKFNDSGSRVEIIYDDKMVEISNIVVMK
jgi:hypothetical protein